MDSYERTDGSACRFVGQRAVRCMRVAVKEAEEEEEEEEEEEQEGGGKGSSSSRTAVQNSIIQCTRGRQPAAPQNLPHRPV